MTKKEIKRVKELINIKEVREGFTNIYQTNYFTFENDEYKVLVVFLDLCNDYGEKEVAMMLEHNGSLSAYRVEFDGKCEIHLPEDFEHKPISEDSGEAIEVQILKGFQEEMKYLVFLNPEIVKVEYLTVLLASPMHRIYWENTGETVEEFFGIE